VHRALPDRPSLEYLKKEAKELLRTLQQQRPVARLADAQHALARQYGFTSWIQLKRHVEGPAPAASPFAGTWKANPSYFHEHSALACASCRHLTYSDTHPDGRGPLRVLAGEAEGHEGAG
jgi:hypothetical protein